MGARGINFLVVYQRGRAEMKDGSGTYHCVTKAFEFHDIGSKNDSRDTGPVHHYLGLILEHRQHASHICHPQ